jgi:hypothetical protein
LRRAASERRIVTQKRISAKRDDAFRCDNRDVVRIADCVGVCRCQFRRVADIGNARGGGSACIVRVAFD